VWPTAFWRALVKGRSKHGDRYFAYTCRCVLVLGFTWYSLIDQIDWDIERAERKGAINARGLYDLDRQPRPVAAAYHQLLEEYGRATGLPHSEIFTITDRPAELRVTV